MISVNKLVFITYLKKYWPGFLSQNKNVSKYPWFAMQEAYRISNCFLLYNIAVCDNLKCFPHGAFIIYVSSLMYHH